MRARSRVVSHKPAGDRITVTRANVPSEVAPGATFEIELDIATDSEAAFLDPDWCPTRTLDVGGIRVEGGLLIDGQHLSSDQVCIAQGVGGGIGRSRTISARVTAPSGTGTARLTADFRGANSGNDFGDYTTTITVKEGAGGNWSGGDDGGNGAECAGLVDALTKPECSLDNYIANAQSGALIAAGGIGLMFLVLASK